MQSGTGLDGFAERHHDRLYDVGIAEGHAVAMCAGMAKQGMLPVFAVYSTFLQRSYDMLLHDVALQQLHVVFGVDRAGLVGADGETHQGVFDLAFLSTIPHMTVLAPASYAELRSMLRSALYDYSGPVAVRYPRGTEDASFTQDTSGAPDCVIREGTQFTLAGYGNLISELLKAADLLAQEGISCEVLKLNQLIPLHAEQVIASVKKTHHLAVVEEVIEANTVGHAIATALAGQGDRRRASDPAQLRHGICAPRQCGRAAQYCWALDAPVHCTTKPRRRWVCKGETTGCGAGGAGLTQSPGKRPRPAS